MSDTDARRGLIEKVWAAAWDRGDVDALDELLSPDYRRRGSDDEHGQDLTAFKASILAARSAFPDLTTTIEDVVIEEWTFNFGPHQLIRVVRLENGYVEEIKHLGYGY